MKIALVHDYLTQNGGAERVFELFCKYFPEADIYTSLYDRDNTINLEGRNVKTTILQKIPYAAKYFRLLAPFYFWAFRSLDLQDYELIISSTSSFAKSVLKSPKALHICFCHNVTRFLWDTKTYLQHYHHYRELYPIVKPIFRAMRKLDLKYSKEPDLYIANSEIVAQRIREFYHCSAKIINYPINYENFKFADCKDEYYLVSSRLISYKRIDIIVEAFNWLGWPLIIIGDGPEKPYLESRALDNIRFLGYVSDDIRMNLMARARSIIIAAFEDYGLVPIEANASGTPVIAYGAGGVLDTQLQGVTGLLFKRQTPESLQAALLDSQNINWDYATIREHAINHFSEEVFFKKIEKIFQDLQLDVSRLDDR